MGPIDVPALVADVGPSESEGMAQARSEAPAAAARARGREDRHAAEAAAPSSPGRRESLRDSAPLLALGVAFFAGSLVSHLEGLGLGEGGRFPLWFLFVGLGAISTAGAATLLVLTEGPRPETGGPSRGEEVVFSRAEWERIRALLPGLDAGSPSPSAPREGEVEEATPASEPAPAPEWAEGPGEMPFSETIADLRQKVGMPGEGGPSARRPPVPPSGGARRPSPRARPGATSVACAGCGRPIPAGSDPHVCPLCRRPLCEACEVESFRSGAQGRCPDCRRSR